MYRAIDVFEGLLDEAGDRWNFSANGPPRESEMMLIHSHRAPWRQGTPEKIGVTRLKPMLFDAQDEEELEDDLFFDDDEEDESL